MTIRPITRAELPVATVELARYLLGKIIVRELPEGEASGRVVETEAYPPGDAALHAYRGITARNRSLFKQHGHAYVYLCYGVSQMLNVSSEADGIGAGVLFRAIEPLVGVAHMMARRGTTRLLDVARGPGRLTQALGIARPLDGLDLCEAGPIYLATDDTCASEIGISEIGISTRIGITRDADRPLRFFVSGNRHVSGPGKLNR